MTLRIEITFDNASKKIEQIFPRWRKAYATWRPEWEVPTSAKAEELISAGLRFAQIARVTLWTATDYFCCKVDRKHWHGKFGEILPRGFEQLPATDRSLRHGG